MRLSLQLPGEVMCSQPDDDDDDRCLGRNRDRDHGLHLSLY